MAKISNMLLVLCVVGFLSSTMVFSMYIYVRGRLKIITYWSKYIRLPGSYGDKMDLQENAI